MRLLRPRDGGEDGLGLFLPMQCCQLSSRFYGRCRQNSAAMDIYRPPGGKIWSVFSILLIKYQIPEANLSKRKTEKEKEAIVRKNRMSRTCFWRVLEFFISKYIFVGLYLVYCDSSLKCTSVRRTSLFYGISGSPRNAGPRFGPGSDNLR